MQETTVQGKIALSISPQRNNDARAESKVYFNGDLTFLKPLCNGLRIPFSQCGRTDHEELKGRAKDGVRPFDSSETLGSYSGLRCEYGLQPEVNLNGSLFRTALMLKF